MLPPFIGALVSGGFKGTVTLSGESVSDSQTAPTAASAAIRIDQDGNVYKITNTSGTQQIDTTTDWIRPSTVGKAIYQVRYTNKTGVGNPTATTAEDIWHIIGNGDWTITLATTSGTVGCSFDIEIRLGTGATLASTSYSLSAASI